MDSADVVMPNAELARLSRLSHFFEKAYVSRVSRAHNWRRVPFLRSTCEVLARPTSGSPIIGLFSTLTRSGAIALLPLFRLAVARDFGVVGPIRKPDVDCSRVRFKATRANIKLRSSSVARRLAASTLTGHAAELRKKYGC